MLGVILKNKPTTPFILLLPYYFYLVNINSLIGVLQSLRGHVQITWSTPRHSPDIGKTNRLGPVLPHILLLILTIIVFADTLLSVI